MNQDLMTFIVTAANIAFTGFRIVAHVPQMLAVVRDPHGARAVSVTSWAMFAMANSSNAVYALVLVSDRLICAINLLSAASCMTVAGIAFFKQRRARHAEEMRSDLALTTPAGISSAVR